MARLNLSNFFSLENSTILIYEPMSLREEVSDLFGMRGSLKKTEIRHVSSGGQFT
jgi:hypothetical protein